MCTKGIRVSLWDYVQLISFPCLQDWFKLFGVYCLTAQIKTTYVSMKMECDYLNGWIQKQSHTQKISPRNGQPHGYKLGNTEEEEEEKEESHLYETLAQGKAIYCEKKCSLT